MEEAVHGISGGLSGLVAILVWYPIDTLRFREQSELLNCRSEVSSKEKVCHKISFIRKLLERIKNYCSSGLSTYKFAKNLIKTEGISVLYNGITSGMVGTTITYFIYFTSYKFFKNIMITHKISKGVILDSLITSYLAACVTAIGSNPIWILNSRMAKSNKDRGDKSNWEMIQHIYKDEGLSGFFKGLIPALFMTSNPVIQFVLYELLRVKMSNNLGEISGYNIVLISIISKYITTIITYPMLTIKTLFQANETKSNSEIIEILIKLFKEEGIGGYYKGKQDFNLTGISAKIVQTLINNVILMFTYEKIQTLIKFLLTGLLLKIGRRSFNKI